MRRIFPWFPVTDCVRCLHSIISNRVRSTRTVWPHTHAFRCPSSSWGGTAKNRASHAASFQPSTVAQQFFFSAELLFLSRSFRAINENKSKVRPITQNERNRHKLVWHLISIWCSSINFVDYLWICYQITRFDFPLLVLRCAISIRINWELARFCWLTISVGSSRCDEDTYNADSRITVTTMRYFDLLCIPVVCRPQ